MELLNQMNVGIHVVAGVSTLVAGPIAIFYNEKKKRQHRMAGQIFFWSMNVVCVSAIFSFFKEPDQLFRQFLFGISIFVYGGILRGVRAIQIMKGGSVGRFDFIYSTILGVFGIWMLWRSGQNWWSGGHVAFSVLFGVFGWGACSDAFKNYRAFLRPENLTKLDWYKMHVSSMIGAFIASTTAFTVNVGTALPWYVQWFGPTVLLVPLQVYFLRKLTKRKTISQHTILPKNE